MRKLTVAIVCIPMLFGCSSEKPAAAPPATAAATPPTATAAAPAAAGAATPAANGGQSMDGMAMMAPVTIPKGVIYTEADVHFMQGMIAHHGQAIFMAGMAAAHHAEPHVLKLANKIGQSQIAEIRIMQDWLRRNGQMAPDTSYWRTMMMPGMLTAAQLKSLEAAKGTEFDKEFLTLMIQHHTGALKMVSDLFATPLAGQDVDVSVFANDVVTVQTAEIGVMQGLLDNMSDH
jgi:uncharacterized protein (DUF305 family)